jgi:hypothetical protein
MEDKMNTLMLGTLLTLGLAMPIPAQNESHPFDAANAVINTDQLFAIGAREGSQAIRGSFGWPTFQKGLVDRVYFRFDPDGYARFAATPRLDTDVFEVHCKPRTKQCTALKKRPFCSTKPVWKHPPAARGQKP